MFEFRIRVCTCCVLLQAWYPESFSPSEDNIYAAASDGKRVVQLQSLADTGMEVIEMVDQRLKKFEDDERRRLGRWGFLKDIDEFPYSISTNNRDIGKVITITLINLGEERERFKHPRIQGICSIAACSIFCLEYSGLVKFDRTVSYECSEQ